MNSNRRDVIAGAGATLLAGMSVQALAQRASAWQYGFDRIQGGRLELGSFRGKPVLVVNTASRCGFTRQYTGLQQLWTRYQPRGLIVIGVPSNDFGGQEPGSNADIAAFCSGDYGVTFPLAARTTVSGSEAHPFYAWAARERPTETPRWNFHKYLIGRNGQIAAVFPTSTAPTDDRVILAIEKALAGVA
ncbi:MAG: glutathione peroxidase [Bosea sp. (in: a-proteobacteria)]